MQKNKTFGEFITQKRYDRGITVRRMAEIIGTSPSYYSDIERGRRNPPDSEAMDKLIRALGLSDGEQIIFFDLVGKARSEVSPDLPEYIMANEEVRIALRIAKEKASPADWQRFIDDLERK